MGAGELPEGGHEGPFQATERPLCARVEFPERGHGVGGEFDPDGMLLPRRENVHDPAPPGIFAGGSDEIFPGIAVLGEGPQEDVAVGLFPDLKLQERAFEVLRTGQGFQEPGRIRQDQGRPPRPDFVQKSHSRGYGFEGGRDLQVRIIREGGKNARRELRAELAKIEPARLFEGSEGPGGGADDNQPFLELQGEAGEEIRHRRVRDAGDPKALVAAPNGFDDLFEFRRIEEKTQAHPDILDHSDCLVHFGRSGAGDQGAGAATITIRPSSRRHLKSSVTLPVFGSNDRFLSRTSRTSRRRPSTSAKRGVSPALCPA